MVISPSIIVVASSCAKEGLIFDKDWEKEITQKSVDIMFSGTPWSLTNDKMAMIKFLRTANLAYMCRLINSFLFNLVMPRLESQDYVHGRDKFCMYKVMVRVKVNLSKIMFSTGCRPSRTGLTQKWRRTMFLLEWCLLRLWETLKWTCLTWKRLLELPS